MADPRITLEPQASSDGTVAFRVVLYNVRSFTQVKIELHEAKFGPEEATDDAPFGTIAGVVTSADAGPWGRRFLLTANDGGTPDAVDRDPKKRQASILMGSKKYYFDLPRQPKDEDDAATYFLYAKLTDPAQAQSNKLPIAWVPQALRVGEKATYDWHAHNELMFFHSGNEKTPPHDKTAFAEILDAISNAEKFVFIADWSFQPYFRIDRTQPGSDPLANGEGTVGDVLVKAAKKKVMVAIHTWLHGSSVADEHNDDAWTRFRNLSGGGDPPPSLFWRASNRSLFYTHHQKFVVCDVPTKRFKGKSRELRVFFGGLDLTKGRWDWHEHFVDPYPKGGPEKAAVDDFKRRLTYDLTAKEMKKKKLSSKPFYDDWYNAEFQDDAKADVDLPRQPWHDIHASLIGPAAWDIVREFVGRWNNDPKKDAKGHTAFLLDDDTGDWKKNDGAVDPVNNVLLDLLSSKDVAQQWQKPDDFGDGEKDRIWSAQVYRSMERDYWELKTPYKGREHELQWVLPNDYEMSIQEAYRGAIDRAKKYIYIETQYFISSCSKWVGGESIGQIDNDLAHRIAQRLLDASKPKIHCYIIVPMYPEGDPVGSKEIAKTIRYYEWRTMECVISELVSAGKTNWQDYVSFYFPAKNSAPRCEGKIVSRANDKVLKAWGESPPRYTAKPAATAGYGFQQPGRKDLVYANNRHMTYVHSKLMMVDDQYIILGSANLNERSLNGARDSEICMGLWPSYKKFEDKCRDQLKAFRNNLFKEHFGSETDDPTAFAPTAVKNAKQNYVDFRTGKILDGSRGHCCAFPLKWDTSGDKAWYRSDRAALVIDPVAGVDPTENALLPDADDVDAKWMWHSDWGVMGKTLARLPE